ncbi:MAG: hypothetical protein Q7K35_05715 [bacterium]|nr:hypothetical protein [bacterium]
MTSNKILIILLCAFLLAGSVYLGILTLNNLKIENAKVDVSVKDDFPTVPTAGKDKPTDQTMAKVLYDSDVEWLIDPVKLNDLKLVDYASTTDPTGLPEREYYRVATVKNGGEIINEFIQPQNPGGKQIMRFHKTAQGKYFLISKNSEFQGNEAEMINKAAVDRMSNFISLNAPKKVTLSGITFIKQEWSDKMPLDWNNQEELSSNKLEKIGRTASGDFYKKLTAKDHNLFFAEYVLKLPDSTAWHYYMPLAFLADDKSLIATFNSASQEFKAKKFNDTMSSGCSISAPVIATGDLTDRLSLIGTTSVGGALYAPKAANDELFKVIFDYYKIGRTGTVDYDDQPVLTYEELAAKKPAVIWRDALGDYHILYDSNYSTLAECGKPVIYLYPESKTNVKVKVGANVRISEPNYGAGWRVTAYPDGRIINSDGAVYENLYWEGLGRGEYPVITSGRVVKTVNIEAELRRDLAALGLNKNEAEDFMEFWLPKMPATPFVRLTWLNTSEMNELAPLFILPRPETVARVFLDFVGQDTEVTNLKPQQLQGFERKGFTVVEWGGLLVGGK